MDLEKACHRAPKEEPWYCMRKSGVAKKMYEDGETVVRCVVGVADGFTLRVGLQRVGAILEDARDRESWRQLVHCGKGSS